VTPRPILLVRDPLAKDVRLHHHTEAVLNREGYLVLRCPPEAMGSMKVIAACPFTADDVAVLRKYSELLSDDGGGVQDSVSRTFASIADRIEAML
jgi:hypothetical protein